MPHSFNKIWIHAIWSTKNRLPFLNEPIEQRVREYMRQQLKDLGCPVRIINGMPDHVHGLFLLSPQKSVAEVVKQVKGSTSHWVNGAATASRKNWRSSAFSRLDNLLPGRPVVRHPGYAAYPVSESVVDKVYQYILRQKEHHQQRSFQEEYEEFLTLHKAG